MPAITFLASSPTAAARLRTALADRHRLIPSHDWKDLLEILDRGSVAGFIVDVDYCGRKIGWTELETIRTENPDLAMVVYGHFKGPGIVDLFRLGQIGVDEIILAGTDDTARHIQSTIATALARALARRVEEKLAPWMPEFGLRALRWAVEHAHEAPRVPDLAESLRMSQRTLSRHLRRAGLPPANRLLIWGRLFQAAQLLEHPDMTVAKAAYRMGYSSGSALGRALRRETGVSPTALASRGGVAWVLDSFLRSGPRGMASPTRPSWGRAWDQETKRAALLSPYG